MLKYRLDLEAEAEKREARSLKRKRKEKCMKAKQAASINHEVIVDRKGTQIINTQEDGKRISISIPVLRGE